MGIQCGRKEVETLVASSARFGPWWPGHSRASQPVERGARHLTTTVSCGVFACRFGASPLFQEAVWETTPMTSADLTTLVQGQASLTLPAGCRPEPRERSAIPGTVEAVRPPRTGRRLLRGLAWGIVSTVSAAVLVSGAAWWSREEPMAGQAASTPVSSTKAKSPSPASAPAATPREGRPPHGSAATRSGCACRAGGWGQRAGRRRAA